MFCWAAQKPTEFERDYLKENFLKISTVTDPAKTRKRAIPCECILEKCPCVLVTGRAI